MRVLRKRQPTEAELAAAAAADPAEPTAAYPAPDFEPDYDDGREESGQPAPGAVEDTTRAVERALGDPGAETNWSRWAERITEPEEDSERADRERLAELERQIANKTLRLKHAGDPVTRRRAERNIEALDAEHSRLFRRLYEPTSVSDSTINPHNCTRAGCDYEASDRADLQRHRATCRPTY